MKKDTAELTLERLMDVANLMKQLRIPLSIIEMAKELDVKRTDLMRFVNEHSKNITWRVATYRKYGRGGRISSEKQVAVVTGVYLDPHENPETEEYAEDRKQEHWIRLERIFYEGWVFGFQVAWDTVGSDPVTHPWENQPEDIEKFKKLPGVGRYIFPLGFPRGFYWSKCHDNAVMPKDFDKMVEEGHKQGLRFHVVGYHDREINALLKDMPETHYNSTGQMEEVKP